VKDTRDGCKAGQAMDVQGMLMEATRERQRESGPRAGRASRASIIQRNGTKGRLHRILSGCAAGGETQSYKVYNGHKGFIIRVVVVVVVVSSLSLSSSLLLKLLLSYHTNS